MKKSTMVLLIILLVLVFVALVVAAVYLAPVFTYSLLSIFLLSLFYIFTERWTTHDAVEFENRFWTFVAGLLSYACLFTRDSPIRLPSDQPGLGWTVVVVFTFLAHNYDRHLRRLVLSKVPNIRRIQSAEFGMEHRVNAKQKLAELRRLLSSIDQLWLSSTFQNMFLLPRVSYIENKIIAIFAEANADELNIIMMNIELGLILYKVKDHRMSRQLNRTKLLHTLSIDRVGEMNVSARAMLLDGLQRMKLSAHHQSEQFVKNIIMKTKEDDLSELKSLTDSKGDFNSMHKLIYVDIRNETIKNEILQYILKQAEIQAAHNRIGSRAGKRRGQFAWRKILSDVDDTLSCSGGSWPAGIDTSFPKKAIYPGVLAFYKELDLGTTGNDEWDNSRLGNLVFLSARPHVYKDVSENITYQKFRWLQETRGLHTSPSLLAGSLDTGGRYMVEGDSEPLAMKKFENFREYLTLYPEFSCIFVGDNGQGDVRTAEMVLSDVRYRNNLQRVYIHEIQPLYLTYARNDITKSRDCERICYFNTYVDAAIDAHKHKLIRSSGLRRVMEAAVRDFEYIPLSAWAYEPTQEGAEHFGASIAHSQSHSQQSQQQSTGATSSSSAPSSNTAGRDQRSATYSAQRRRHHKSRLFQEESNREKRVRELNRAISRGNAVLSSGGFGSVRLLKFTARYAIGTPVVTLLGVGVVTRFRPTDGMYEVSFQWDSTGEMPPVKAFLTGAALLSSDASAGAMPSSSSIGGSLVTGSSAKRKDSLIPVLRRAVSVVKPSSLPKPVVPPGVVKKRAVSVSASAPTSPMNSYFAPHSSVSTLSLPSSHNSSRNNENNNDVKDDYQAVASTVSAATAILNNTIAAAAGAAGSVIATANAVADLAPDTLKNINDSSVDTHTTHTGAHTANTVSSPLTPSTVYSPMSPDKISDKYREKEDANMIPLSFRHPLFQDRVRGQTQSRPVSRLGSVPEEPPCGDPCVGSGRGGVSSPFLIPDSQLGSLSQSPFEMFECDVSEGGKGGEGGYGGEDDASLMSESMDIGEKDDKDGGSMDRSSMRGVSKKDINELNRDINNSSDSQVNNQHDKNETIGKSNSSDNNDKFERPNFKDVRPQSMPLLPSVSSFKLPDTAHLEGGDDTPSKLKSRTQSMKLTGTQFLDQKLLKRISESNFLTDSKDTKTVKSNSEKAKVKGKDVKKDVNEILKERLTGVRGARVWTPYGLGMIASYRPSDDHLEVLLEWGATSYLRRDSVVQLTEPIQTCSYVRVMRGIIEQEEKEKDEIREAKRLADEIIERDRKELENQLKIKLQAVKEAEEEKIRLVQLKKEQEKLSEKNRLSAPSPPVLDSGLSPERRKKMFIIPALSRALSPLHLISNRDTQRYQMNKNKSKDDLILLGKDLNAISINSLHSGSDDILLDRKSPKSMLLKEEMEKKEKRGSGSVFKAGNVPGGMFSRGWMHWPAASTTPSIPSTPLTADAQNIQKNKISTDLKVPFYPSGLHENKNKGNNTDNESGTNALNGMYVRTPYGYGIVRDIRIKRIENENDKQKEKANHVDPSVHASRTVFTPGLLTPCELFRSAGSTMPDLSPLIHSNSYPPFPPSPSHSSSSSSSSLSKPFSTGRLEFKGPEGLRSIGGIQDSIDMHPIFGMASIAEGDTVQSPSSVQSPPVDEGSGIVSSGILDGKEGIVGVAGAADSVAVVATPVRALPVRTPLSTTSDSTPIPHPPLTRTYSAPHTVPQTPAEPESSVPSQPSTGPQLRGVKSIVIAVDFISTAPHAPTLVSSASAAAISGVTAGTATCAVWGRAYLSPDMITVMPAPLPAAVPSAIDSTDTSITATAAPISSSSSATATTSASSSSSSTSASSSSSSLVLEGPIKDGVTTPAVTTCESTADLTAPLIDSERIERISSPVVPLLSIAAIAASTASAAATATAPAVSNQSTAAGTVSLPLSARFQYTPTTGPPSGFAAPSAPSLLSSLPSATIVQNTQRPLTTPSTSIFGTSAFYKVSPHDSESKTVNGNEFKDGKELKSGIAMLNSNAKGMEIISDNKDNNIALLPPLPMDPVPLNSYNPYLQVIQDEIDNYEGNLMKKKEMMKKSVEPVKAAGGVGSSLSYFTSSIFDILSFRATQPHVAAGSQVANNTNNSINSSSANNTTNTNNTKSNELTPNPSDRLVPLTHTAHPAPTHPTHGQSAQPTHPTHPTQERSSTQSPSPTSISFDPTPGRAQAIKNNEKDPENNPLMKPENDTQKGPEKSSEKDQVEDIDDIDDGIIIVKQCDEMMTKEIISSDLKIDTVIHPTSNSEGENKKNEGEVDKKESGDFIPAITPASPLSDFNSPIRFTEKSEEMGIGGSESAKTI